MHARELFRETIVHVPPHHAVEALGTEDAERRAAPAMHSIAEIVAHMTFWMRWFAKRCEGRAEPVVTSAATGWPAVPAGTWPTVHAEFLRTLEQMIAIGETGTDRLVQPAIEFGPLAHYTVGDALVHSSTHNAHHIGQIIVLRQLMNLWPPPSGGWTW